MTTPALQPTSNSSEPMVDIHCHLIPGIDDGAKDWDESLEMARMAIADGIGTMVMTPHQLGSYSHNGGDAIRQRTADLQAFLNDHDVPLRVLPGGEARIEPDLVRRIGRGEVVSLADRRRHVLIELPHDLYIPLDRLLEELAGAGIAAILAHPERNKGILAQPAVLPGLVRDGCLLQVTAGSFLGAFGATIQKFSETLLVQRFIHFVSTDAHGPKLRRPLLGQAFERVAALAGSEMAVDLFCRNPACVAEGREVIPKTVVPKPRGPRGWLGWKRAG